MVFKKLVCSSSKQKIIAFSSFLTLTAGIFFTVNRNSTTESFLDKNSLSNANNYGNNLKEFSMNSSITPFSALLAAQQYSWQNAHQAALMDAAQYQRELAQGGWSTHDNAIASKEMNEKSFDP